MRGEKKADKKHVIMKTFMKQDGVYRQKETGKFISKAERNGLAKLGVIRVKKSAFEVFLPDFIKSPGYNNMSMYCNNMCARITRS